MDKHSLVEMWQQKVSDVLSNVSAGQRVEVIAGFIVDGRGANSLTTDLTLISLMVHSMIAKGYEEPGVSQFEAMERSKKEVARLMDQMLKDPDMFDILEQFKNSFFSEKTKPS
tara:strand:- start:696 stop:1034 length:339 start_codon:yes stop_codon:yes gene_type:complete